MKVASREQERRSTRTAPDDYSSILIRVDVHRAQLHAGQAKHARGSARRGPNGGKATYKASGVSIGRRGKGFARGKHEPRSVVTGVCSIRVSFTETTSSSWCVGDMPGKSRSTCAARGMWKCRRSGPGDNDGLQVRILNRILAWRTSGTGARGRTKHMQP